jgi:predicted outer membrane protein
MDLRKALAILSFAASIPGIELLLAQQPSPTAPAKQAQAQPAAPRAAQGGQRAAWLTADQTLATCLAIDNQGEIAIAQFVQARTKNDDVKEFAQMLMDDHKAFLKKLERYAPEATRDGYLNSPRQTTSKDSPEAKPAVQAAGGANPAQPAKPIQQTAGAQPNNAPAGQAIDFIQLHREVAEQCIADSKQMLSKKEGNEADTCFVGHQIARHAAMKTQLTVFERHASGELGQILSDASETVTKHMEHAEKLMEQLADAKKSDKAEQRN